MDALATETSVCTAGPIQLEVPGMQSRTTLIEALQERKSTREFDDRNVSRGDLAGLLWAADGINRADGHHTAGSAMNKQDVDIYVLARCGAFQYRPDRNILEPVTDSDLRQDLIGVQTDFPIPPMAVVLTTTPSRFDYPDAQASALLGAIDVGIVAQNIMLYCAANGMVCVPRACMDRAAIGRSLGLSADTLVLLNIPIGYPKR